MRVVRLWGEAVEVMPRLYLTDEQLRRTRALQMLAMRRTGATNARIARYFRVTDRHVRRLINAIPPWMKDRVDVLNVG